jgi:hypothetical protein
MRNKQNSKYRLNYKSSDVKQCHFMFFSEKWSVNKNRNHQYWSENYKRSIENFTFCPHKIRYNNPRESSNSNNIAKTHTKVFYRRIDCLISCWSKFIA